GKSKSRYNHLIHGLTSRTVAAVARYAPTLGATLKAWTAAYPPRSAAQRALLERAVVASVQRQRCIMACHARLLAAAERGDPVAAIVGDDVLLLYSRYEQLHDALLRKALDALFQSWRDAVGVAPHESDAPGGVGPRGYY